MSKPAFCICENKGAAQLHSNCAADQCLCFHYIDSTIPLLPKSEISSVLPFCGSTARYVSDLVGNPEDRFSHDVAHLMLITVAFWGVRIFWIFSSPSPEPKAHR